MLKIYRKGQKRVGSGYEPNRDGEMRIGRE